jgi:hypothetical protein
VHKERRNELTNTEDRQGAYARLSTLIHLDPFPSTTYVGPLHFVLARHMTSIDALIYVLVNARTWLGVPRPQDAHLCTARTKGPRALHTGLLTPLTLSPMAMRWHALSYPKGRGAQGVGVGVGGGGWGWKHTRQ